MLEWPSKMLTVSMEAPPSNKATANVSRNRCGCPDTFAKVSTSDIRSRQNPVTVSNRDSPGPKEILRVRSWRCIQCVGNILWQQNADGLPSLCLVELQSVALQALNGQRSNIRYAQPGVAHRQYERLDPFIYLGRFSRLQNPCHLFL